MGGVVSHVYIRREVVAMKGGRMGGGPRTVEPVAYFIKKVK